MLADRDAARRAGRRWPWAARPPRRRVRGHAVRSRASTAAGLLAPFIAVGLLMVSSPATGAPRDEGERDEAAGAVAEAGRGEHRGGLRTQVIATAGPDAVTLVSSSSPSLVGFVANLVAIPLVMLVITCSRWPGSRRRRSGRSPRRSVQATRRRRCARLAMALGGAVWTVAVAPWPAAARRPPRRRARRCCCCPGVPGSWPLPLAAGPARAAGCRCRAEGSFDACRRRRRPGHGRARAHAPARVLLFDSGPAYSRESDAGQRVLVPLPRSRGEHRLDLPCRATATVTTSAACVRCGAIRRRSVCQLARRRRSAAAAARDGVALRRRPALALGRRRLRGSLPPPARRRTHAAAERDVVRARVARRWPQRAADR